MDVFADQQDAGWVPGGPIMSAAERRASEDHAAVGDSAEFGVWTELRASEGKGEVSTLRRGSEGVGTVGGRRDSEWSCASAGTEQALSPSIGFTSLPPPPRKGAKRYVTADEREGIEIIVDPSTPALGNGSTDLWGRRGSDIANLDEPVPSAQLPRDHPFAQVYTAPRNVSISSKSSQDREHALAAAKVSNDGGSGKNRFGDAPPLPALKSYDGTPGYLPSPKRAPPRSPRSIKAPRPVDMGLSPPPRSSSRINDATSRIDLSTSPSLASSITHSDGLIATPVSADKRVTRESSVSSFPKTQWQGSGNQKQPGPVRTRSSSFSSSPSYRPPHHSIPIPDFLPDAAASPIEPLRYQLRSHSPRSSSSIPQLQRPAVLSPTRPSVSRHGTDQSSLGSAETPSVGSDDEDSTRSGLEGGYEVSVKCINGGIGGEVKWEVTMRSTRTGGTRSLVSALPVNLSSGGTTSTSAPRGANHLNLSLSLDQASGTLSFDSASRPLSDLHATPTRRFPSKELRNTSSSRQTPNSSERGQGQRLELNDYHPPHSRGHTFGSASGRKLATGLAVEEVDGYSLTSSPTSSVGRNKLDRRDTITPPPRMETPPPMPSHPHISTTPVSSSKKREPASLRHSRSTSQNEAWFLSPALAPSTPTRAGDGTRTPPRSTTPRELTYVSSPSPRSTPRRTRIISASQLNGGLFAHGTVDGMSEDAE